MKRSITSSDAVCNTSSQHAFLVNLSTGTIPQRISRYNLRTLSAIFPPFYILSILTFIVLSQQEESCFKMDHSCKRLCYVMQFKTRLRLFNFIKLRFERRKCNFKNKNKPHKNLCFKFLQTTLPQSLYTVFLFFMFVNMEFEEELVSHFFCLRLIQF